MSYSYYPETRIKGFGGMNGLMKGSGGGGALKKVMGVVGNIAAVGKKYSMPAGSIVVLMASFFASVHAHRMSDPVKNSSTSLTKLQKEDRFKSARTAGVVAMVLDVIVMALIAYMAYKGSK
jgi:hypothetical protein